MLLELKLLYPTGLQGDKGKASSSVERQIANT